MKSPRSSSTRSWSGHHIGSPGEGTLETGCVVVKLSWGLIEGCWFRGRQQRQGDSKVCMSRVPIGRWILAGEGREKGWPSFEVDRPKKTC